MGSAEKADQEKRELAQTTPILKLPILSLFGVTSVFFVVFAIPYWRTGPIPCSKGA